MNDDTLMNVGSVDRAVRVVAGMGVMALYFFGPRTHWALLGAVLLATGLVGASPLYWILGISTRDTPLPARLR